MDFHGMPTEEIATRILRLSRAWIDPYVDALCVVAAERLRSLEEVRKHYADHTMWNCTADRDSHTCRDDFACRDWYQGERAGWDVAEKAGQ
jgi:hypothetical protein